MTSRFLNFMVTHMSGCQAPFSVHRINPANLFSPTTSLVRTQDSAQPTIIEDVPLPPAEISYRWPSTHCRGRSMDFMAFGSNRDKIVGMDSVGRSFLYDFSSRCITTNLLNMTHIVMNPMPVAVADNGLFVMSDIGPQFVFLTDGCNPNSTYLGRPDWFWRSVQLPPFASSSCDENKISAYTAVGNSQILVSTFGAGTYSFDTQSREWNKAGDWALPFRGRVEYLPEHNLWFGFSHKWKHLCAADLTDMSTVWPPVPQELWKDLVWPEDWKLRYTDLLPLGSGKLCIARFFTTSVEAEDMDMPDKINNFLVLAGVEVISREGNLCFIKHKSERYSFGRDIANPL